MSGEPTPEQVQRIREQIHEEELRALIRDTIEQLERLGDRLENYVTEKISQEPTEPVIFTNDHSTRTDAPEA